MKIINEYIQKIQAGNKQALEEFVIQMSPLIKKYASKIHFLEYEDSLQELYVALLECIPYLDYTKDSSKLLKYIQESIIHKYYFLCKKYLSLPEMQSIEITDQIDDLGTRDFFEETIFDNDYKNYLELLNKSDHTKAQIMYLSTYAQLSDKEISKILGISRQYVNRIKKIALDNFLKQYS